MIYICVELTSGKEDKFTFQRLANAVENAHMLNRLEPKERWVVTPSVPLGAYTKISPIRLSTGRE